MYDRLVAIRSPKDDEGDTLRFHPQMETPANVSHERGIAGRGTNW